MIEKASEQAQRLRAKNLGAIPPIKCKTPVKDSTVLASEDLKKYDNLTKKLNKFKQDSMSRS